MTDVWSSVAEQDAATQERLADVLETRGADPQQQAMRRVFLGDVDFAPATRVLEVGCGTGVLTRTLARWRNVASVVGVDVAPSLLERARDLGHDLGNVTFEQADAHSLPFGDGAFGGVIFDSTLSHVRDPERAIGEAFRVLAPFGCLAVFDGDYATATVALGDHDPIQTCVDAMMAGSVTDRWLMRRLPTIAEHCGFEITSFRSHGFVERGGFGYMLTVVERGADVLSTRREIGEETAAALKAEARRRVDAGTFFGHIAYASLVGRKPDRGEVRASAAGRSAAS